MTEIPDSFIEWLHDQVRNSHYSQSEASRQAGLNQNAISDIVNRKTRSISIKTAIGLGRVFGVPPEDVLRQAKVLPPLPGPVREERETLAVLRSLSPEIRSVVVQMLCALKGYARSPNELRLLGQSVTIIDQQDIDKEIAQFLVEFPELRSIMEEAREHLSDVAIRALMANVEIVIKNPTERLRFIEFHKELSAVFDALASTA